MVRTKKKAGRISEDNRKDKSLESWIWDSACSMRGARNAPNYKLVRFYLPLVPDDAEQPA